jgi:teichuronic acid biosynthesis glycosyltransferase TuaC
MHVLVIPSWFPQYPGDPSGSFFATQAAGVAALGGQVGIIYPDLRPVFQLRRYFGGKTEWSTSGGVNVLRNTYINWTPRVEPLILPQWIAAGLRLFDEYCARFGKPDVMHAHCLLRAGVLAERIAREHGIPYVVTEHSSRWHKHEVTAYELPRARLAAKNAHVLISVSKALLSHLEQDVTLGKTSVVPNAVDPLFLAGELNNRAGKSGLTFINVALLNPGKRHDILVDSFHRAFGRDTTNRLHIVGDGPERKALEQRIAGYGMEGSVSLAGLQEKTRVAEMLSDADCFVLTSDHETFGVVVTEALAKGIPVVSTRCGGTDDIVAPDNGIMTEAGNVQAVADALTTMQQRIRTRFYDAARIRAGCIEKFSQRAVCTRLVDICREAAGSRGMREAGTSGAVAVASDKG